VPNAPLADPRGRGLAAGAPLAPRARPGRRRDPRVGAHTVTSHRQLEFDDDRGTAIEAISGIASGKGWCNLTPEIDSTDVEVLSVSVFSLRTKRGSPVATLVTSPPRRGTAPPGTLGVLHTRGRLG